jgi:diguanylate cyclase (GGDEF)-like protein
VPRRVALFIGVYAVLAIGLAVIVVERTSSFPVPDSVPWPLISLAYIAADFVPVRFHREGQALSIDLMGIPMLVGLVFTSPLASALSVTIGIAVSSALLRTPFERSLFNVVSQLGGLCLARLVMVATLGSSPPTHLRGLVAMSLAVLIYEVFTMLGVLVAVTLSLGWPGFDYLRTVAIEVALIFPLNAILGAITVTVALAETWGLALLAVPGVVLALWYRAANTVRNRYANLQLLYGFTVKLSGLADTEEIIAVALDEARSMLQSRRAELSIPLGETTVRCVLTDDEPVARFFGAMRPFDSSVALKDAPVLMARGRRDPLVPETDFDDLMAVPMRLGDAGNGVLTVGNHQAETETFDAEDLRLLEAVAANLSTALTSSQRLDRLRLEVAAREHQALHDGLTGLANRTLFSQWVSHALERRRTDRISAVMLMDLDGFKDINDTLGHHAGDAILKEVAGRILASIGTDRQAARLGGDEFGLVVSEADSVEEIMHIAESVLEAVSRPISIDGLVLEPRASVGVAMAPQHGSDQSTLLQRADVAMYAAKSSKRGVVAYDRQIDQNTTRRLTLAGDLRQAMDSGDLELWYQPVAWIDNGQISGLEGLLRWRHSEYGSISPNEFIPVAEQTGLIEPLTWWVLDTALRELRAWRREGYELSMAVNLSARNLLGPDFVERVGRQLSDVGVPPASLTLEVTESHMMADPDGAQRVLTQLAGLGVKIAIDDFGTGYSSLSRLKRLPVHTVKIDRSFVMNMHNDINDDAIVRSTIELARNMGHYVIAEGVEIQQTWDRLAEMGCDQAQGYLLSAAMPSEECRKWVQSRQAPQMAPVRTLARKALGA